MAKKAQRALRGVKTPDRQRRNKAKAKADQATLEAPLEYGRPVRHGARDVPAAEAPAKRSRVSGKVPAAR